MSCGGSPGIVAVADIGGREAAGGAGGTACSAGMAAAGTTEDLHTGAASGPTGTAGGSTATGGMAVAAAGTLVATTSAGGAAAGAKPGA